MDIIQKMLEPGFYNEKPEKIEQKQTHISHVFLTDEYAYKVKKSVDFGFLDFTSLEKRKFYCEEEIRLNKRLSPDIYEGVVPITKNGVEASGEPLEYAVKMKRLPEEKIMAKLLNKYEVGYKDIKEMALLLAKFYKNAARSKEIDRFATTEAMKKNTDQNFEQTKDYDVFDKEKYEFIKKATNEFYKKDYLFNERIKEEKIAECHGDLHSGNIFLLPEIKIFDCVEFNKGFRYSDVANDIAFLAMDLDKQRQEALSKYLISKYVDITGDYTLYAVLDFYKCYRAFIRAKINAFMLDDNNIDKGEKEKIREECKDYLEDAYHYAIIFSNQKPAVIISCGLTATGKSRWLRIASDIVNSPVLRTDEIRREVFNLTGNEEKDDDYRKEYYNEKARQKVYDKMFSKAKKILSLGGKVSLDASFISKNNREEVKALAEKYNAEFIIINTNAKEETVKERLKQRQMQKDNISDADFENAYKYQKENFEKPSKEEGYLIELDTEAEEFENIKKLRKDFGDLLDFGDIYMNN
ncbi:MAG: AAA family ATPase [Candidatus Nanoarchaeia archaeon]